MAKQPIKQVQYARDCKTAGKLIRDGIYYCDFKGAGCHTAVNCMGYKPKKIISNEPQS
jgi:hypothetical protein